MVIRKLPNRREYVIYSEKTGRRLSKPYPSRSQAEVRLRQIEFFKHRGKK